VFSYYMLKQSTHTHFVVDAARTKVNQLIMIPPDSWRQINVVSLISFSYL
jgi:hypothetical protein